MSEFDEQDRPIEDGIRRYARSADAAADHRAIAVRAMATPERGRGPTWGIAGGIVTVAAAAVIVVALLAVNALRPDQSPVPIGGPSATPSASQAPSATARPTNEPSPTPSPAATAEPSASAAPSATAQPSASTEPPASAGPSASSSPLPSVGPTVAPSATFGPTSSPALPGTPVPAGFAPLSVTFVSADEGFALGSVACGTTLCPAVAHTLDAARTWSLLAGAPKTSVAQPPIQPDGTGGGVSAIRFADPRHGWLFGPELWATADGGATWTKVALPSSGDGPVNALETAAGRVHAVVFHASSTTFRIVSADVGSDAWVVSATALPVGAGPVPSVQLALSRDAGWVLQNDRTVVNGARLVKGAWESWNPICADVVGPAYLAAATPTKVVAACDVGAWSTPDGTHLFVSSDGGLTAHEIATRIPVTSTIGAATPDAITVAVTGTTASGNALVATFDGGASWRRVLVLPGETAVDLGFTTQTHGVVVVPGTALYITRDGGHTWAPVAF